MTDAAAGPAGHDALLALAAAVAREAGAQLCDAFARVGDLRIATKSTATDLVSDCLLYTSPSPRDGLLSRMPSSA